MRVNCNPFRLIVSTVAFFIKALEKLVNMVAQNRFVQPQPKPKLAIPGEVIILPPASAGTTIAKTSAAATEISGKSSQKPVGKLDNSSLRNKPKQKNKRPPTLKA